jgi:sensor histidine kinase YesM
MVFSKVSAKYRYHLLFWIMVVNAFVFEFNWVSKISFWQYIHVVWIKTALLMLVAYTNILWLIPIFWKQKRYVAYVALVVGLVCFTALLINRIDVFIWRVFAGKDFNYNVSERLYSDFSTVVRYLFYSFLLQITVEHYNQEKRLADVGMEKLKAEFMALQVQVNPHFLFNTLNNLYGLILDKSEQSAEVVLRLADLLKYILSEGKHEKVALGADLAHLKNYIELECLRLPHTGRININWPQQVEGCVITPLLLLPLVENAFKHGVQKQTQNGYLNLRITVESGILTAIIQNGKSPDTDHSLGVGIQNVERRLALLYPGRHTFQITETDADFRVLLQLPTT